MAKVTKEDIKLWENKYGKLKVLVLDREVNTIEDPKTGKEKEVVVNKGLEGYFRKPDRATLSYALSKAKLGSGSVDMIGAGEIIMKKCWLGGDEGMNTDEKYYYRLSILCYQWLSIITGFLPS